MTSPDNVLLHVEKLVKYFPIMRGLFVQRQVGAVHAVDGISFDIQRGETLGLVGESGCGKSTTGRAILQLQKPTSGKVIFEDVDLVKLETTEMRKMRRKMQMIFQDPYASLNPRMTIGEIIGEPLRLHHLADRKESNEKVIELLRLVGLNPAYANRYPHEFSGGQRQRVGIARSLSLNPSLVVCDEPISALDVSIQAQVVNLLEDLQQQFNLTYLFIAHDLSMVRHITTRDELYNHPLHPYTEALLSAVPIPDPALEKNRKRIILEGDVPSPVNPPSGCRFRTRCPRSGKRCSEEVPEYREVSPGHFVACHSVG
jgi:oligopeptide transport system ATP-binding protein